MIPRRAEGPQDWPEILHLIQTEFAYMEHRIAPPSSMHSLTEASIAAHAEAGEVWVIGTPPVACVFFTAKPHALYIGKLAVARAHRRRGHAQTLIAIAATRARALGLPLLELQTRVELTENHAAFTAMGFGETGREAHPGFAQPTAITYQKSV